MTSVEHDSVEALYSRVESAAERLRGRAVGHAGSERMGKIILWGSLGVVGIVVLVFVLKWLDKETASKSRLNCCSWPGSFRSQDIIKNADSNTDVTDLTMALVSLYSPSCRRNNNTRGLVNPGRKHVLPRARSEW